MSWEQLPAEIRKIPPITRYSIMSAVLVAGPLFMHFLSASAYAFDVPSIRDKLQVRLSLFIQHEAHYPFYSRFIDSLLPFGFPGVRGGSLPWKSMHLTHIYRPQGSSEVAL